MHITDTRRIYSSFTRYVGIWRSECEAPIIPNISTRWQKWLALLPTPTVLHARKWSPATVEHDAGCAPDPAATVDHDAWYAPEPVWTLEKRISCPSRESAHDSFVSQPVALWLQGTDCAGCFSNRNLK